MSVAAVDTLYEYYREMKSRVFGRGNLSEKYGVIPGRPNARFTLNRNYDLGTQHAAYKFLVELSETFGPVIMPVRLENECINLTVSFDKITDENGHDFRTVMLADERYHDIFERYDITMIRVENFPGAVDRSGNPRPSNSKFQLFLVDKMGRASVPSPPSP